MEATKTSDENKGNAMEKPADFETAIQTTGFGAFNYFMLIVAWVGAFANCFETTTMSYILPIAECDLRLSLEDKGYLNAATYAGMIISAIFWGYLADTQGRRKLLIICYLLDAFCVFASSLSQNTATLITFKFLGGVMVNGPSAILYTYFTEIQTAKNRPKVMMFLGMATSCSSISLPLLAWAIFPRDWDFVLFGALNVHSWQIFLFVCCLPSLISGLLIILLPESPKFLMSQGRNKEALCAFQKIYSFNTRLPRDTYPIKQLVEEAPSRDSIDSEFIYIVDNNIKPDQNKDRKNPKKSHRSFSEAISDGMEQMKPLFRKPLLQYAIFSYAMHFTVFYGLNTIRLWLPQLFASFSEVESLRSSTEEAASLCNILEYTVNKTTILVSNFEAKCLNPAEIKGSMYINNIIVSSATACGYVVGGPITRAIGEKRLMIGGLFISACLGMSLYWSIDGTTTLIISATYLSVVGVSTLSLIGTVIALFPTSLRTIVVASCLMFGRLGALTGNMIFPIVIKLGCLPPFVLVGVLMMCASALALLFPNPKKSTFT